MGQGWPFAAGPWSDDGVREVWRSQTRMQGHRPFGSFWGVCQKGLAREGETRANKHLSNDPSTDRSYQGKTLVLTPAPRRSARRAIHPGLP